MRRIQIREQPPEDWLEEAKQATALLSAAKDETERKEIVRMNEKLWRDARIRDWLLEQFANKCWYSESKDAVSSIHVDHYRPKGKATDDKSGAKEEGYWWLAFVWTNYRMAGELLNVKKRDVFPLGGGMKATSDHRHVPLDHEDPILLDPCTEDASLVSFERDEAGCSAVPSEGIVAKDEDRCIRSIDILGLNRLQRLSQKRGEFWDRSLRHIKDYEGAQSSDRAPSTSRLLKAKAIQELRELVRYEAEFSMVCHACVEKCSPDQALVKAVFAG